MIDESYDWFGNRSAAGHSPWSVPPYVQPHYDPVSAFDRPVRGGAIQPLSRDALIGRSLEVSASSFTTIISIIQGVALAILADSTFRRPSPLVFAQSLATLLVLVCVFYTYVNMSILLRWAPSFLDSFLPFAVASLEIPPAYFLGNAAAWNSWLAALWLGGAGGFFHTIRWSPPSHFGTERMAHRILHRWLGELVFLTAVGGLTMGGLGILAHVYPAGRVWWTVLGVATTLATAATLVARTEIGSSQIHERFGVSRPPFN